METLHVYNKYTTYTILESYTSWHIVWKKIPVQKNVMRPHRQATLTQPEAESVAQKRCSPRILLYLTSFNNLGNSAQQRWLS